jgi:hypothetical protein
MRPSLYTSALVKVLLIGLPLRLAQTPSVPSLIGYQGKLPDASTADLATGEYALCFRILNDATSKDTTANLVCRAEYERTQLARGMCDTILAEGIALPKLTDGHRDTSTSVLDVRCRITSTWREAQT